MDRVLVLKAEIREVRSHCCETMTEQANFVCDEHDGAFGCPDHLIYYSAVYREYGLICHSAGEIATIEFCPWCGSELPASLRDAWFAELKSLGIDPWDTTIPSKYLSSAWIGEHSL